MFPSNAYVIRAAIDADQPALCWLADVDGRPHRTGPALIGELDCAPATAISLDDGSVVANPFKRTGQLAVHLRMRASGLRAHERTPSVGERIRAALRLEASSPRPATNGGR